MYIIKISLIILSLFLLPIEISASFTEKTKGMSLILSLSNVELDKAQRTELEKNLAEYKKRFEEVHRGVVRATNKITLDLSEAQQKLKNGSEGEVEYLNKKISLLNDRKQNLLDFEELWKDLLSALEQDIKILDDKIDFSQAPRSDIKPAYAWKDFRDNQIKIAEHSSRIENYRAKRDYIKKQKVAAGEQLSSWEKQRIVKNKEREKLIAHVDSAEKIVHYDSAAIKFEADLLAQNISALNEKIDYTKLLIEKLDIEQKYWDDVIDLDSQKFNEQIATLGQIESRLVLDYNDVEASKDEWKSEVQHALSVKDALNKQREPKKDAKERLAVQLEALKESLTEQKGRSNKDVVEYQLTRTQYRHQWTLSQVYDKELRLLDARKDLADLLANEKELQYNSVELRYRLKFETENVDELLATFQNKKDLAVTILRGFKDKRTEAITALIETNRSIDKIKGQLEKLKTRRPSRFKGREVQFKEILTVLSETKKYLILYLDIAQSILAVNADLITHQEKIINQYDLIIDELEARHKTYSIWKRSPRAISLEALVKAGLEAEMFFKKLYWETPTYLKLSTFITFIKSLQAHDFLMLLLFFVFYIILFYSLRHLLSMTYIKGQQALERYKGHTRFLYLQLALAIVNLALEHYKLVFTWFFIALHIFMDFRFIFSTLFPLASNYSIAVFYLLSIPVLVYLASSFISRLRELNTKLSYLFFAETFQDKFILLVSLFCYATAILLPLRLALLYYTNAFYSDFATVILGAYSLILVLVVAFLFSKEDVLKFIPSNTGFFIWLKRKIDKHYYPVFLFIMSLFILSNPYIGYSNLAWFLAFAVPSTVFLLYLLMLSHYYIRKYAIFLFMREEDEEVVDKFEHAKAYYGFFVIFSFLVLIFAAFIAVSRIWGFTYTPADIWKSLSEEWVLRIGVDTKLGFVQFLILSLFITAGFLISSFIHRFILSRLFDILRSEPGTQNTISRISHYTTIFFAMLLGLSAIHLEQFFFWICASFGIVLGLALKDIISDLVAGFFVLIERPIEIGNYINIDNVQGTVHKISARSTTIITSRNHSVIIPNKDLITKWIVNWGHGRFAVGLEVNIRVDTKSDPDLVKKLLLSIVQAHAFILKVPAVVVRMEDIEENAHLFLVRAFISARRVKEQWDIAAALRTEVIKVFRENGIEFSKPERIIDIRDFDTKKFKPIDITFDK